MDFSFFERLSDDAAQRYLAQYLATERDACQRLLVEASSDGVSADFTPSSISHLFAWLAPRLTINAADPPPASPDWIVKAMDHFGGFREFADESFPLVLRASFYLGESFVAAHKHLSWATGQHGRAEVNQPVVTGFRHNAADLAPLLIAENLLQTADSPDFAQRVESVVANWQRTV